jgi:hypothetical protein
MQASNRLLDFPKPVFSMLWQFMQRFSYELAVLSRGAIKYSSACA